MDFFAQQDKTRRKTKLLVFYFILAVAAIIAACYFVGLIVFNAAQSHRHYYDGQAQFVLWDPKTFLWRYRRGARRDFHRQRLQNE